MRRSTSRWIVGVSAGAIIHIGIFWIIGALADSEEVDRKRRVTGATLQFIGSDTEELSLVMREQIMLFDPKPLMMPTQWNGASFEPNEAYENENSAIFVDYLPMFVSDSGDFVASFGNSWHRAGSPREIQLEFPFVVAKQFGREAANRPQAIREGVGLEVIEVGSGRTVISRDVYSNDAPSVFELEEAWESVEFLLQVMDSFQEGVPLVVQSSRFPDIDRKLGEILTKELLPKGLLGNGSYLVRISR